MTLLEKLDHYRRFAAGMHRYLRHPLPDDPLSLIRRQMESRESNWLETLHRVIFTQPGHPYQRMFELARCSYEDLVAGVKSNGVDTTLSMLREAGVYLTHEELKGDQPIIRSGEQIPSHRSSFDNPLVLGWFDSSSSASRSTGTTTSVSTPYLIHRTAYRLLEIREFGLDQRVFIPLRPILPASSGVVASLVHGRLGYPMGRWFANGGPLKDSAHYRILTSYLTLIARIHGVPAAFPTHLPANDFAPVAACIDALRKKGQSCAVESFVSPAVRVASAALQHGFDIEGTVFLVGGEALTAPKRSTIESAGARVFPRYGISEIGDIGRACSKMNLGNCVHLLEDSIAVVTHRRKAELSDVEVDSLLYTTLLPSAPRILINAESKDAGTVARVSCDCAYNDLGLRVAISDIGSFGKLTGHGVSLVGGDIVRILEETLPRRFGGAPGDYQLVEQEGDSQTQLELRVSPRVTVSSLGSVQAVFLSEVRKRHGGALASRVWSHTDAFRTIQAEPAATFVGKVQPLHLLSSSRRSPDAP